MILQIWALESGMSRKVRLHGKAKESVLGSYDELWRHVISPLEGGESPPAGGHDSLAPPPTPTWLNMSTAQFNGSPTPDGVYCLEAPAFLRLPRRPHLPLGPSPRLGRWSPPHHLLFYQSGWRSDRSSARAARARWDILGTTVPMAMVAVYLVFGKHCIVYSDPYLWNMKRWLLTWHLI